MNKFYVLTGAKHQESSYGDWTNNVSYFIRWIAEGVGHSGSMPADQYGNGDGVVSLEELWSYIRRVTTLNQHAQRYPAGSSFPLFK